MFGKKNKEKKEKGVFKPFQIIFSYAELLAKRDEQRKEYGHKTEGFGRLAKGIPASYSFRSGR